MKTKFLSLLFLQMLFIGSLTAQTNAGYTSQPVNEFAKTIKNKAIVLIDVRTPAEYASGHIEGSVNIDVNDPDFATKALKAANGKTVALYCRSGRRSKTAASQLSGKIKTIFELESGINGWTSAGLSITK